MSSERYVGLMSGTSLDGVDAALVDFGSSAPRCLATHYIPYPDDLRGEALAIQRRGENELERAALLANRLADIYAEATRGLLVRENLAPAKIRAIGCHGQTIRHAPALGYSLQANNPSRLAEKTGIAVVADFRNRDIAAGGQGAPLVPAFHEAMFRASGRHRVILNIGGIANLSNLEPNSPTRGFDCGPGNMLLDAWVARHLGTSYDAGGNWAKEGQVLPSLLEKLRGHPFFLVPPPKSCGREEFGYEWLEGILDGTETPSDVQATLVALTATTIGDAITRWCGQPDELYVCGGGAHNTELLAVLADKLPGCRTDLTDVLDVPADWVEAMAFAWLAYRTVHGLPGNLPEVTGAVGSRVLGAIYPA